MKPLQIVIFCGSSVALMLALSALLYPFARLPDSVISANTTPMPLEKFDQLVDMGSDYGSMTVTELMGYYLDNPPTVKTGSVLKVEPKRQFGGC